ncbi:hypothetical protein SDC9_138036 [bioreactor metagenome]|uniref:Uncharacterized protein n=1 Tax=bioreactor metagenome TaxID=1076179 RepID=A0A645DQB9_9ZZZZ
MLAATRAKGDGEHETNVDSVADNGASDANCRLPHPESGRRGGGDKHATSASNGISGKRSRRSDIRLGAAARAAGRGGARESNLFQRERNEARND